MTTAQTTQIPYRATLRRLVDEVPDEQLSLAVDFMYRLIETDDEPLTEDEIRQIEAADAQIRAGEFYTLEEAERILFSKP